MPTLAQALKRAIERRFPAQLAAKWDNTGLLLEAPTERLAAKHILVAIDLTEAVADEAISTKEVGTIVAYHPIIFRGLKALTLENPQQRTLLRLAAAGISVYSPHTAVDAITDGVNDWLVDMISCGNDSQRTAIEKCDDLDVLTALSQNGRKLQQPPQENLIGFGRRAVLDEPQTIRTLINRIKTGLNIETVQLAGTSLSDERLIHTVAVCAGSGGSIVGPGMADLIVTGELSHHEILAITAVGGIVVLCNHSNTERAYIFSSFREELQKQLHKEGRTDASVLTSEHDRDPIIYV